jgi:hypothetical protein
MKKLPITNKEKFKLLGSSLLQNKENNETIGCLNEYGTVHHRLVNYQQEGIELRWEGDKFGMQTELRNIMLQKKFKHGFVLSKF